MTPMSRLAGERMVCWGWLLAMGCLAAACGAPPDGVTLTLVADDGGALPAGTYVVELVVDGAPAQVAWTLAGTTPYADVALVDGRRLLVTAEASTPRRRALRLAIVDGEGVVDDPAEVSAALRIDGERVAAGAYVVAEPELWLRVPERS
jgi:hypothetical protein